jgi:hypothetical protein
VTTTYGASPEGSTPPPVLYLIATGVALLNATIGIILFLAVGCGYLLHTGTQAGPIHPDDAINRAGTPYDPPAGTRPDEGAPFLESVMTSRAVAAAHACSHPPFR